MRTEENKDLIRRWIAFADMGFREASTPSERPTPKPRSLVALGFGGWDVSQRNVLESGTCVSAEQASVRNAR